MDKISKFSLILILITGWIFSGWPPVWQYPPLPPKPQTAAAAPLHMLLFWDGGSAPTGWSIVTTYDGKFPRGESAANFATTGGNSTHTPTTSSVVHNTTSAGAIVSGATSVSNYTHTHTSVSVTVGSASNLPAHKGLKLIQFDAGIPVSIPTGAIAIFDAAAPSGWTRQSAYDGYMIMASSTAAAAAGSDTHTHSLTWSTLSAASQTSTGDTASQAATTGHTHTAPNATATASATALPPYIQVIIAKADSATASLPNNMIAMFDGTPNAAWTVASDSGGAFYQKLIRGATTYSTSPSPTGATTHNHANETSGVSGGASNKGKGSTTAGTAVSTEDHTHTVTAAFNTGTDNMPPWFNVVYAKKNTNVAPNAPTQNSPSNGATGVSLTPTFTMTATDDDQDNLGYKVTIYSNSGCTTVVQTNDQSVSSTGWTGTNATCTAAPTACYASSTQASYLTQSALSGSTQYWWKASAKDPDGSTTFTDSSTCNNFTTEAAASLTFIVSTDNFPALTPGSPVYATSTLSVTPNNATGWYVTLSGNNVVGNDTAETAQALNDGGSNSITDLDPQWTAPAATTTTSGAVAVSSGDDVLAFRVMSASGTQSFLSTSWWGADDTKFTNARWAGLASSTNVSKIGNTNVTSGGSAALNTVQFYVDVSGTQPMGTYTGTITFTAVMN